MKKHLKIVEDHRASKGIRLANYLLDLIALIIINIILSLLFNFLYTTTSIHWFLFLDHGGFLWELFMGSVVSFIYYFLSESISGGKTFGKMITQTRVISVDGTKPGLKQIFLRNIVREVPFDSLSFLGENGWHDRWTDTRVVTIKKYEADKQAKSEIDTIGNKEIA